MSSTVEFSNSGLFEHAGAQPAELANGLRRLAALPGWLRAALDTRQVSDALGRHVPEFASGALKLRGCKVKRLLLKDDSGRWSGTYTLTTEAPESGQKQTVALFGTLTAPRLRQANGGAELTPIAFGAAGWHCYLPELGLELEPEPPETALAALPQLTEAALARTLLEQSIRACSPAYADLQIAACTPEVLSYKPGSRCVIRYHLEYPPELAERGWPTTVIAKTYRKDSKARNAYDGMRALWETPLSNGTVVTIAEPLAYVSEHKLMVQSPVAEELTLEDLLKDALRECTPELMERLYSYMRKAAAGLAAFHMSGAQHGATATLEGRFPEIRDLIERLAVPEPELEVAATPLLERLVASTAAHPAGALVPTHGTFNPEQVLINGERIGFIDFDDFCMAEPALDVGLFCSAIRETGMSVGDAAFFASRAARLARQAQLDAICEAFVAEYEQHAPISRPRVALWQGLDFLRHCLHYWTKVKPAEPDTPMLVLEHLLREIETYGVTATEAKAVSVVPPLAMSFVGGALLIAAFLAPAPIAAALLAVLAAASLIAGRAALRHVFDYIDAYPRSQRLALAGALSFGLSTLAVTLSLAELEPLALANAQALPGYLLLIALFAPAVFIITAVTGAALGVALRSRRASAMMALTGGFAAALAFVLVDVVLDHFGLQADLANLTSSLASFQVLALSDLGAALAGCIALGLLLVYYRSASKTEGQELGQGS
jgi:hypothetical protein